MLLDDPSLGVDLAPYSDRRPRRDVVLNVRVVRCGLSVGYVNAQTSEVRSVSQALFLVVSLPQELHQVTHGRSRTSTASTKCPVWITAPLASR